MAKKILINGVVIGARRYYAGDLLDASAEADAIAAVESAGGQLLDPGDPVVDAAAEVARQMRRSGQSAGLDSVLIAALAKAGFASSGPETAMASSATATNQTGAAAITVEQATAANQAATLSARDYFVNLTDSGVTLVSIGEQVAQITTFDVGEGIRNVVVVFPVGWEGGDLVWAGTLRGASVQETFASPGAGGGTVTGAQLFSSVATVTNTAPGGNGAQSAQLQLGTRIGTSQAPVAAVEKVTVAGAKAAIGSSDLTAGWVDVGAVTLGTSVEIVYSVAHSHAQSAHNHAATDAGHTHAQNAHTHSITLA